MNGGKLTTEREGRDTDKLEGDTTPTYQVENDEEGVQLEHHIILD